MFLTGPLPPCDVIYLDSDIDIGTREWESYGAFSYGIDFGGLVHLRSWDWIMYSAVIIATICNLYTMGICIFT